MEIKDRIKVILEHEKLSQVDFAEKTGIKPAALNHVLKGRNNASRDVIDKILSAFPWYEADWLVLGQGPMLNEPTRKQLHSELAPSLFPDYTATPAVVSRETKNKENNAPKTEPPEKTEPRERKIEKIIVYYTDNTFEVLKPGE